MRSGYVAANVPPIIPPHELPTKCVRSHAEAVEDIDDAARAFVESEWGRELLAAAVSRRVDEDHLPLRAEVLGLRRPHVAGHQQAWPEHHRLAATAGLYPYPPQRGVDLVFLHRWNRSPPRAGPATRRARPMSVNRAGMMTVRTTKVSSRIPRPTMMPTCVSTINGSTPSTQNTAASTMPALVMTAPVAETARTIPSVVPCDGVSSRALVTRKIV